MRLIDADALVKILELIRIGYQFDGAVLRENTVKTMIDIIANPAIATTIEAEPVRHGKWEEYQIPHIICCSECDYGTCVDEKTKFCPHCGAKMDLK